MDPHWIRIFIPLELTSLLGFKMNRRQLAQAV